MQRRMALAVEQLSVQIVPASGGSLKSGWRRRAERTIGVCSWLFLVVVLKSVALLCTADLWWPATLLMFSPRWLLLLPGGVLILAALLCRRRALVVLFIAVWFWPWLRSRASAFPGRRFGRMHRRGIECAC